MDTDYGKILNYLRSIPPDKWQDLEDYAPRNPKKFLEYLQMLPFTGYNIDVNKFKIIGKL